MFRIDFDKLVSRLSRAHRYLAGLDVNLLSGRSVIVSITNSGSSNPKTIDYDELRGSLPPGRSPDSTRTRQQSLFKRTCDMRRIMNYKLKR